MNTAVNFETDLGEPDANRGVALDYPVDFGKKPEAEQEQPEEVTEEVAEGQNEEVPEEVPEQVEETPAEGPQKLRAKDFADQAGWTLEEFYRDVLVPTDDGDVTLSEVVDGFKEFRTENESLRQELQAAKDQAPQGVPNQQYSPVAMKLMERAAYLQEGMEKVDWSKYDKVDALTLKDEYREEIGALQRQAQEEQHKWQQETDKQLSEYKAAFEVQIRKDIPEWRNNTVRSQEVDGITQMLSAAGFKPQAIEYMKLDPVSMSFMRKAWKAISVQESAKREVKKVVKVPKSLAPDARRKIEPDMKATVKAYHNAKSRSARDKALLEVQLDDALLNR